MDLPADFPIQPKSFSSDSPAINSELKQPNGKETTETKLGHPTIEIGLFKMADDVIVPKYATSLSSGFDFASRTHVTILPGQTALISTGIKVAIPPGYELQVRSKSGLALKNGIVILNSPGTVDADYRNEVGVILKNTSQTSFEVTPGMKIAQGVICPVYQAVFQIVSDEKDLGTTVRGQGGFGSTGVSY